MLGDTEGGLSWVGDGELGLTLRVRLWGKRGLLPSAPSLSTLGGHAGCAGSLACAVGRHPPCWRQLSCGGHAGAAAPAEISELVGRIQSLRSCTGRAGPSPLESDV